MFWSFLQRFSASLYENSKLQAISTGSIIYPLTYNGNNIITNSEKLKTEEFFDYAKEILPERRGNIMTIAEQLRQEGKMEGMKKGITRNNEGSQGT